MPTRYTTEQVVEAVQQHPLRWQMVTRESSLSLPVPVGGAGEEALAFFWFPAGGPANNLVVRSPTFLVRASLNRPDDITFLPAGEEDFGLGVAPATPLGTPDMVGPVAAGEMKALRAELFGTLDSLLGLALAGSPPRGDDAQAAARLRALYRRLSIAVLLPAYRALNPSFFAWLERGGPLLETVALDDHIETLRFLPDGGTLVCGQTQSDVSLWRVSDGHLERWSSFPSGLERLYDIALSPDGTRLATTGLATAGRGQVRVWGTPQGGREAALEQEHSFPDGYLLASAFSPDGTRVLAAGSAEELRVVNLRTRTAEQDSGPGIDEDAEDGFWLRERSSSLVFHPNGQTLLVTSSSQGGSAVLFCDLRFGREGYFLTERNDLNLDLPADVLSPAAFSPDGQWFAFADWDLHLYRFPGQERVFSFEPRGERLPGAPPDRGSEVVNASWSNALWTPDGKTLVCGSPTGAIFLWDVPSGDLRETLTGHDGGVLGLGLDPSGARLVSSGYDKTLRLWRLPG
jgi:WD40 repeat protein